MTGRDRIDITARAAVTAQRQGRRVYWHNRLTDEWELCADVRKWGPNVAVITYPASFKLVDPTHLLRAERRRTHD